MAAGPATGSFARELIEQARADVVAVDEQARRKERRGRRALAAAVTSSLLISLAAVAIALPGVERIAKAAAPEVFPQLVAESRAQRAVNCRADLGAANAALIARRLPPVADPGPTANADQVCTRASSAQVFSVLPDDIAERLLDEATDGELVLPLPAAAGGNTTSPGPGAPPTSTAPAPGGTSTTPSARRQPPTPAPAPEPARPAPDEDGLLPRLVPIPIPRLLQPLLSA